MLMATHSLCTGFMHCLHIALQACAAEGQEPWSFLAPGPGLCENKG